MKIHWRGLSTLIVATLLWGSTFVVVKQAVVTVPPSVLVWARFTLAAACFMPFMRLQRPLWLAGGELGLWLLLGYGTQTMGLQYTTASRSAFIGALYVIVVPLLMGLVGSKVRPMVWLAALLAFAGVSLLSYDGAPPNVGDLWTLATAMSWGIYIWRLEAHASRHPPLALTGTQLWTMAIMGLLWVCFSDPEWLSFSRLSQQVPWLAVVYLGMSATAMTTLMQTWGQRHVNASEAAVIYTLEPVWAFLFAYSFLGEILGWQGLLGAGIIAVAMVLSQLPWQLPRWRKT